MIYILLPAFLVISCSGPEKGKQADEPIESQELAALKTELDSVADLSQQALLKNVSAAIKEGGTAYAVEFCNLNAIPLTDSLSTHYGVEISRITEKTRNPDNGLKTENDRKIYDSFLSNNELKDSLIQEDGDLVYYKRINTAMPACIKCHGNPTTDIEPATLNKIRNLYPDDKAVGYGLNEFRGLWKIVTN